MHLQQHKMMLAKVLSGLTKPPELNAKLGFKGGTCAMFFYGLPRISVDLDFDFLQSDHQGSLGILTETIGQFGKIDDYQDKYWTIFYELNYGHDLRNMKIEIRKRGDVEQYERKNFMGENILVMKEDCLFANKLLALLGRKNITNRDIFDIWFFLNKGTPICESVIIQEKNMSLPAYLQKVAEFVAGYDFRNILYGLGELVDDKQKNFAKTKMRDEILGYLALYQ